MENTKWCWLYRWETYHHKEDEQDPVVDITITRASFPCFPLVDVRYSGSSSDALIFTHCKLKEKINGGTLGFLPLKPLVRGALLQLFLAG